MLAHEIAQQTRDALQAAFPVTAHAIMAAMSGDWRATTSNDVHVRIERADGVAVAIHLDTWKRRIDCSPSVPQRNGGYSSLRDWGVIDYKATGPSASCAADRDPKAIARDFMRKVVEPYAPLFVKIQAQALADQQLAATGEATYRALVAALGGVPSDRDLESIGKRGSARLSLSGLVAGTDSFYGDVTVSSHSCEFHVRSISHGHAVKLAKFLKGLST